MVPEHQGMTFPRVWLAISAYRSDQAIAALLAQAAASSSSLFERIVVVDSQGSGAIPRLLEQRQWPYVMYYSASDNLGSAGNLALRLRLAAEGGCEYVYALNHDGAIDVACIHKLVEFAQRRGRIGAVYPLRFLTSRRLYDLTGIAEGPVHLRGTKSVPAEESIPVTWSSSNGALYALAPVRNGLLPRSDLWMGYEDLEYGQQLRHHGYEQFILTTACVEDNYEYRSQKLFGRRFYLSDKPAWYAYYFARNLILISRGRSCPLRERFTVATRLAQEVLLTTLFRDRKFVRYRMLGAGVLDGLRGRTGKGRLP
jgi:rhamnosyltransferase